MDHVGPKTRSLGQNLEKPIVLSRGLIFYLILMKLNQKVCLNDISDKFKIGPCSAQIRSLGQITEELLLVTKG